MKKNHLSLWFYFATIVFFSMLFTFFFMAFISFLVFHWGSPATPRYAKSFPIFLVLIFLSVMISTLISLYVGKTILKPLSRFSKALKKLASGNFDVSLSERSQIQEIDDLYKNFNIMVRELSSVEMLRNDFVVNVSHEFKTPLSAIEGYSMLLQDSNLTDEEKNEYTQMIIDSSKQLSTLTGNVLKLSRLEKSKTITDFKQFRLDEQIRQTILLFESEWNKKEIELDINLPPVLFKGNDDLCKQIWINLIENAIKYTPKGGCISLFLREFNDIIIFRINDTGCGIDENSQKHIFDKFYQADTTRKGSGNGLGLSIVKHIVDLYKGHIGVESSVGEGASFEVRLPFIK